MTPSAPSPGKKPTAPTTCVLPPACNRSRYTKPRRACPAGLFIVWRATFKLLEPNLQANKACNKFAGTQAEVDAKQQKLQSKAEDNDTVKA
jgi:hypothetical protein